MKSFLRFKSLKKRSYLINQEADLAVCGEAEEGPQAFELVSKLKPDVVVVDISLKGSNGIELVKNLKARWPDLPTLILDHQLIAFDKAFIGDFNRKVEIILGSIEIR